MESSIADMLDLLEEYWEGNQYEEDYHIFRGLALPQKVHPMTFFMVSSLYLFHNVLTRPTEREIGSFNYTAAVCCNISAITSHSVLVLTSLL